MMNREKERSGRAQRDFSVELFRVFCMFAICMQHSIGFSNTSALGFEGRFWNLGVVGFALISGYYGVRLRFDKLLGLWLTALCSVVVVCVFSFSVTGRLIGLSTAKDMLLSNWYLNGYTVLVLLSPVLNAAIEKISDCGNCGQLRTAAFGLAVLIAWSWAQELWGVRDYVPKVQGMGRTSFMALVYIYLIGRCVRAFALFQNVTPFVWTLLGLCLLLVPCLGSNVSPVTILYTVIVFRVFQQINVPNALSKCIMRVTPSLFSVYLLHTNECGFAVIEKVVQSIISFGLGRYPAYVVCALCVFVGCLLLDIPRRIVIVAMKGVKKYA